MSCISINSLVRTLATAGLFIISSVAQASITGSVTVGPYAASVPTLSGTMLLVLGLLLAVLALRLLRDQRGAHKLLSWVILGGGLVIGGVGAERAYAPPPGIVVAEPYCTTEGAINYYEYEQTPLMNACPNAIQIKRISASCQLDYAAAGCKQGQVLAPGASCNDLPRCVDSD
ncbi:MAG: midcut-by-XrtH protein [Gammaproteobacteria bacterium]|nr:midcut-by-XrtH protein [Gammaproteobacteria bacterium]